MPLHRSMPRSIFLIIAGAMLAPVAAYPVTDPVGDTFGNLPVQHDLVELAVDTDGSEMVVEAMFAAAVTPADSGQANALGGTIDIDSDQNPTTGSTGAVDAFSTIETGLGVSYFVDLAGYQTATGDAPVLDTLTGLITGRAPVHFETKSVTVFIPLALLGDDDGLADVAAIFGTLGEATDAAPQEGSIPSNDGVARLSGKRFKVEISWVDFAGNHGKGHVVAGHADDSAIFWFFAKPNWEVMVKVLNGCALNGHYWVFTAATTSVQYEIVVTDTQTGTEFRSENPLGRLAPAVGATDALDVCEP